MYAQVSTIIYEYLEDEQERQLIALFERKPNAFISIPEGDESMPQALDFTDIFESASDLAAARAGDNVYVVSEGKNDSLAAISRYTKPGYWPGEITYII